MALEPEAASIFCRTIDIDLDTSQNISVGERMLVVDAGGMLWITKMEHKMEEDN